MSKLVPPHGADAVQPLLVPDVERAQLLERAKTLLQVQLTTREVSDVFMFGMGAYTLSDRATWISFGNKGDYKITVEGDPVLFNQYGIILVNPEKCPSVKADLGQQFDVVGVGGEDAAGHRSQHDAGGDVAQDQGLAKALHQYPAEQGSNNK